MHLCPMARAASGSDITSLLPGAPLEGGSIAASVRFVVGVRTCVRLIWWRACARARVRACVRARVCACVQSTTRNTYRYRKNVAKWRRDSDSVALLVSLVTCSVTSRLLRLERDRVNARLFRVCRLPDIPCHRVTTTRVVPAFYPGRTLETRKRVTRQGIHAASRRPDG